MRYKHLIRFAVVSVFAIKGAYRLNQLYSYRKNYNQSLADIAKDAIDSLNDLVGVFSNNKQEIDFCDNISQIGKNGIDCVTAIYGR